jgi:Ran GTPase-activating protein (RanGAP) involved in mRNA processing and transport
VEKGGNSHLILSRNRLGDEGLSLLSRSVGKSTDLVVIDVSNNNLTFRGIQALFHHLKQNYSLVEINLASRLGPFKNILGNQGAKAIAAYFHH